MGDVLLFHTFMTIFLWLTCKLFCEFQGSSGADVQCSSYGEIRSLRGHLVGSGDGGREARVSRYREKRRTRLFAKKIRYEVRKLNAEKRPRMKGRFVKRTCFVGANAFQPYQWHQSVNLIPCLLFCKFGYYLVWLCIALSIIKIILLGQVNFTRIFALDISIYLYFSSQVQH